VADVLDPRRLIDAEARQGIPSASGPLERVPNLLILSKPHD
jgi:hypothetical protein